MLVSSPSLAQVYYGNRNSHAGGRLSKDFTQGYGPEVYILRKPEAGEYRVQAKYYASHQASQLTGATSAVVWTLLRDGDGGDHNAASGSGTPQVLFDTVRLDRNKEKLDVFKIFVAADGSAEGRVVDEGERGKFGHGDVEKVGGADGGRGGSCYPGKPRKAGCALM